MDRVRILSTHSLHFWLRQTPQGNGVWETCKFSLDDPEASILFVVDDTPNLFTTCVPRSRRIFVVTEPSGIRTYDRAFLTQFGLIMSPFALDTWDVPLLVTQTGLPWFFGLRFGDRGVETDLSFENLVSLPIGEKSASVSVVCSTKSKLPRHRERLAFVTALKDRLGDRLIIRGRGFSPIVDKAEAISGFRYHLVLENNDLGNFWTEKLADAFLGWTLPIFAGARGTLNDFPEGSMVYIDLENPKVAIKMVESILDDDPYEQRLPLIAAARQRLIYEHNFFALAARVVETLPKTELLTTPDILRSSARPNLIRNLCRGVRAQMATLWSR